MDNVRYAVRDEGFGATLYDRRLLSHTFLSNEELCTALDDPDLAVAGIEHWQGETVNIPQSIPYAPIRVYLETTRYCPLHCRTCFNASGKHLSQEMMTKDVFLALDRLRSANVFDVRVSGGEPTTRVDWQHILVYAKSLGLAVSLNTNGVYDIPDIIDTLVSLELNEITLSVDGGRRHHDYIRGSGNYARVVESISELSRRGASLRLNTVLTRGVIDEVDEILDLASRYVREINFFYMRITGRALTIPDQVLSFSELVAFDEYLDTVRARYPGLNILHGSKVMLRNSILAPTADRHGLQLGGPDGFTRCNILPDGGIWPGGYTPYLAPEYCLGNICDPNCHFLAVWRQSPVLWKFRLRSLELQMTCRVCEERGSRCPGASMEMDLYRGQSIGNRNPYCMHS